MKARPPHGVRRVASRSAEVAGEAAGVRNDQTWKLLEGESIGNRKAIGKPGENHGKTRKPRKTIGTLEKPSEKWRFTLW